MRASSILFLISLLASSMASPLETRQSGAPAKLPWTVTNFQPDCGDNLRCSYTMKISFTAPADDSEPSFNSHCKGVNVAEGMLPCDDDNIISSRMDENQNLIVSHTWKVDGATWQRTGKYTLGDLSQGNQSFAFTPEDFVSIQ